MKTRTLITVSSLVLAACGGGGGGDSPAPTPTANTTAEGQYIGTTNANQTITATVLDDGRYYAQYSVAGDPGTISGVVAGTVTSSNGTLTNGTGIDYSLGRAASPVTLTGSYSAKQWLNGTITYSSGTSGTFKTIYDKSYDTTPSLATATGTYSGTSVVSTGQDSVMLTADSAGRITGHGTNCSFTGTIAPHAKGNVYDISLTFSSDAGCAYTSTTATGIGLINASGKVIHAMLQTPTKEGVLFLGSK